MFGNKIKSFPTKSNLPDRPNLSSVFDRERCSISSEIFNYNNLQSTANKKYYRNRTSSLFSVAAAALSLNSLGKSEKRSILKQKVLFF